MKEEKDILNALKKTDKPSVPQGFFDSFSDNLMSKINEDSFLEKLPKQDKPTVPKGFFDNFSDHLTQQIEPKKQAKIIPIRIIIAVASIAAVFTLILLMIKPNQTESIIAETPVEVVDEFDDYLAYLDESSIVEYIVENNIDIEDEIALDESVYSELDNELDDYYYGY